VGVATIATGLPSIYYYLRDANVKTELLQITSSTVTFLPQEVGKFQNLKLIGISMQWHPQIPACIKTAEILKTLLECKNAKIVVGGITASYFADELIRLPFIDYVIKGDGELPMLLLFQCITGSGLPLSSIPNLCYKQDGEVIHNSAIHRIDETTITSLEQQVIGDDTLFCRTRSVLSVGRGCKQDCVFCGGNKYALPRWGNRTTALYREERSIKESIAKLLSQKAKRLFLLQDYDGKCEMLGRCLQDYDMSSMETLSIDAWGLPLFENIQQAFKSTRLHDDFIVNLEISPECGSDKTRQEIKSFSFSNIELEQFMSDVFSHYKNIRIVLCFSFFLPHTEKHNLTTRLFIYSLMSKYFQQVIEDRLRIHFWPLSTDPGSSIQQNMITDLKHDAGCLADYLSKMLATKSSSGNFLRHWSKDMDEHEIDYLRHYFTYENILRLLYPVLYVNLVRLFDGFDQYDAFLRNCFDAFYDVYLKDSSSSSMYAQLISLETTSVLGFTFSGDETLPKLSLVIVWLKFIERELRKIGEQPMDMHPGQKVPACFCADLIGPLSLKSTGFGRFSGKEEVAIGYEDMRHYVLELVRVISSREMFRLGESSKKRPLFYGILQYNSQKIDVIKERGPLASGLLPTLNPLCEIKSIRFTHLSIPPLDDNDNLKLLGARFFEKLICEADYENMPGNWQRQLKPFFSENGDMKRVVTDNVQELWVTILKEKKSELAGILTDLIISSYIPHNFISDYLGGSSSRGIYKENVSSMSMRRLSLNTLYGIFTHECDIRLVAFYVNHLKNRSKNWETVRPGADGLSILTSIYYPDPLIYSGAFVFSESINTVERETLRLCSGTRTIEDISRMLNEKFTGTPITQNQIKDMMISLYSRQIIY
jgi:hypothetical protein